MTNRDKKFVGNNWLELSDLTIFEAAFWMRIGCEPPDLKYIELFAGYPDITESLSDYNPDWEFDVFDTGDVVASAVRAGLIRVTADISNGGKFDFKHTRINKSDWLDWCRNHGYSELADRYKYSPLTIPATPHHPQAQAQIKNKIRRNTLDSVIEKAVEQAGNLTPADVFVKLKELALNNEKPFTGRIDGNTLFYTNDDDKETQLTKNALSKRLSRRR